MGVTPAAAAMWASVTGFPGCFFILIVNMKKQPGKPVTLAHIAAAAGVTPMTVSRVINESGYVNAATRERVRRVAREMNYRRNGLARGLKRQRTETIGLVLGD